MVTTIADDMTLNLPTVSVWRRLTTKPVIGSTLMILGIIMAMSWGTFLYVSFSGGKLVQIQTSSMQPVLPVGTIVNLHPIEGSQMTKGQIAAFYPPAPYPHVLVVHEIVSITPRGSTLAITTKGVAENHNDPWTLVIPATATLGIAVHTVTPNTLHLLMVLALAAIVSYWVGARVRSTTTLGTSELKVS